MKLHCAGQIDIWRTMVSNWSIRQIFPKNNCQNFKICNLTQYLPWSFVTGLKEAAICIGPQKLTEIVIGCNISGTSGP